MFLGLTPWLWALNRGCRRDGNSLCQPGLLVWVSLVVCVNGKQGFPDSSSLGPGPVVLTWLASVLLRPMVFLTGRSGPGENGESLGAERAEPGTD